MIIEADLRRYQRACLPARQGFTLIELIVSIAIATLITGAIFFSLSTALESWGYSRDQLALQKVISDVTDEIINGRGSSYGIRDSFEIIAAGDQRIEFVPPWTDDTHSTAGRGHIYTLNRRIKPGSGVPIGEVRPPEGKRHEPAPTKMVYLEDSELSQVKLSFTAPLGSDLRFVYHPDSRKHNDTIKSIWWDTDTKQVYCQDHEGVDNIARNPFGVKISKFKLSYYGNTNELIADSSWVDNRDLNMITGVELFIEVELGQHKQSLITFVNLRNSPRRSGFLALRKGTRISIPDSEAVHTLLLTNISGVSNDDELEIEAEPEVGKSWIIKIKFSRAGLAKPKIESYRVDFPAGNTVHSESPRMGIDAGLNFLYLDSEGLYDYDDDEETDDRVILRDKVILKINKMDIDGAALFIRP